MAGKLKTWSTTPANNNAAAPAGWPEGMAPSAVNNTARQDRASVKEWYEDAEWIDLAPTIVGAAGQVFTLSGDLTATFAVGRAIRQNLTSVGLITASSYSAPNTSVTVAGFVPSAVATALEIAAQFNGTTRLISGSTTIIPSTHGGNWELRVGGALVASVTPTGVQAAIGQTTPAAGSFTTIAASGAAALPVVNNSQGSDIASAATINLDTATGNVVNVTGTTTITAITLTNGRSRVIRFTGALQITAGASLVVLPGNASVVTQAGDMAVVEAVSNVKYLRLFRIGAQEFRAATGSIAAADTTITLPAGTYSRVRVVVKNLKANTDFYFGARFNASTTGYATATDSGSAAGTSADGINSGSNAIFISHYVSGAAVDDSNVTANPLAGELIVSNPEATDIIAARTMAEYRSSSGNYATIRGMGGWAGGPVTSVSLHLRTTLASGLGATGVTPTTGSYELWLTP